MDILINWGIIASDQVFAIRLAPQISGLPIEFCCEIYTRAKAIGEPVVLDDAEMQHMAEKFKTYGQK